MAHHDANNKYNDKTTVFGNKSQGAESHGP